MNNGLKEIKPGDFLIRKTSNGWILIVLEIEFINYVFWEIKFLNKRGEIRTMLFDDTDLKQFNVVASTVPTC